MTRDEWRTAARQWKAEYEQEREYCKEQYGSNRALKGDSDD